MSEPARKTGPAPESYSPKDAPEIVTSSAHVCLN